MKGDFHNKLPRLLRTSDGTAAIRTVMVRKQERDHSLKNGKEEVTKNKRKRSRVPKRTGLKKGAFRLKNEVETLLFKGRDHALE